MAKIAYICTFSFFFFFSLNFLILQRHLCLSDFWLVSMVFQGGFMVFGWFPWFFKVVSWFFMVLMVFGWFSMVFQGGFMGFMVFVGFH